MIKKTYTLRVDGRSLTLADLVHFMAEVTRLPGDTPVSITASNSQRDGKYITIAVTEP